MSDERCQVEMCLRHLTGPCGRRTYRSWKCIFHLENKSDEEAKIFQDEFYRELRKMEEEENIKELDFA